MDNEGNTAKLFFTARRPVMSRGGYYGAVYTAVLWHCVPYGRLDRPWQFLDPPADCYRPIGHPAAALAALMSHFSEVRLRRCGVIDVGPDGAVRVAPALVNPAGAIVAQRRGPGRAPYALVTAAGCLPGRRVPVRSALRDHWTASRVAAGGRLYATPHVRELVLLRALDLPATLSLGFGRRSLALLNWLNDGFHAGGEDAEYAELVANEIRGYADRAGRVSAPQPKPNGIPDPDDEPEHVAPPGRPPDRASAGTAPGEVPPAGRPELVLVGSFLRTLSAAVPPALRHPAWHLAEARDNLELEFAGVGVWLVAAEDVQRLDYALRFGDRARVVELLMDSAHLLTDVEDILAAPPGPAAPPAGYACTRLGLLAASAAAATGADAATARLAHDASIEAEIVGPLMALALASANPLVRNAGVELAEIVGLLARMRPRLTVLVANGPPSPELDSYLKLSTAAANLTRDLGRLLGRWT